MARRRSGARYGPPEALDLLQRLHGGRQGTHPDARPSLAEVAQAAAELDGDPLASKPALLRRAATELVAIRPSATADDVLVYAAGLQSRATA